METWPARQILVKYDHAINAPVDALQNKSNSTVAYYVYERMHDLTHTQRTSSQNNGVRASRGSCRARAEGEEETDRRAHVCGNNAPAIRRGGVVKESDAKQAGKLGGVAYH